MAKLRWKDCSRAVVNSCYRATTVLRVGNNKLYENRETVSDFNCQTAKGPTMEEEEERVADYIVGITKVSKPLPSDHWSFNSSSGGGGHPLSVTYLGLFIIQTVELSYLQKLP